MALQATALPLSLPPKALSLLCLSLALGLVPCGLVNVTACTTGTDVILNGLQ